MKTPKQNKFRKEIKPIVIFYWPGITAQARQNIEKSFNQSSAGKDYHFLIISDPNRPQIEIELIHPEHGVDRVKLPAEERINHGFIN